MIDFFGGVNTRWAPLFYINVLSNSGLMGNMESYGELRDKHGYN